ncbi:hypothetical protein SCG7086_AU_00030 [Chlamydiales bacterium SCGC AG-110-P3]|nr:hypothetical protein SCG7086_AU_00030 [Chlamydiales bacterium SCGC AG-110-P3]
MDVTHAMTCFDRCRAFYQGFFSHLPSFIGGLGVLALTVLVIYGVRLASLIITHQLKFEQGKRELIALLVSVPIWTLGLSAALVAGFPNLTPVRSIGILAITATLVAFVGRDAIVNWLSRIYLLVKGPFRAGDTVYCGDVEGVVEQVTAFHTIIRQWDGLMASVPNGLFLTQPFVVQAQGRSTRVQAHCMVEHDTSVDEVRSVIKGVVNEHNTVDKQHSVNVVARELMPGGTDFELSWWTAGDPHRSTDAIIEAVSTGLESIKKPKRARTPRKKKETGDK